MTNFVKRLDDFIGAVRANGLKIDHAVLNVTEKTARRRLNIKKPEPLIYKGMTLKCIGSKRWRYKQDEKRFEGG